MPPNAAIDDAFNSNPVSPSSPFTSSCHVALCHRFIEGVRRKDFWGATWGLLCVVNEWLQEAPFALFWYCIASSSVRIWDQPPLFSACSGDWGLHGHWAQGFPQDGSQVAGIPLRWPWLLQRPRACPALLHQQCDSTACTNLALLRKSRDVRQRSLVLGRIRGNYCPRILRRLCCTGFCFPFPSAFLESNLPCFCMKLWGLSPSSPALSSWCLWHEY